MIHAQLRPYVLGFFTGEGKVALIRKRRPKWQAGLLNGIGGRMEPGEAPIDAMAREFREETGVVRPISWRLYCVVTNRNAGYRIHVFHATGDLAELRTVTDEALEHHDVNLLPPDVVSKVRWLLPLGLDTGIQNLVHVTHRDVEVGAEGDDDRVHPVTGTTGRPGLISPFGDYDAGDYDEDDGERWVK